MRFPQFFPEMCSKLKHMEMMHSLCQQEVELLQQNLSLFVMESVNMQQLLNDFNGSKTNQVNGLNGTNLFAALAFDRYMSQLSAITNMARKFNINLQLNTLGKMLTADSGARGDMGKTHLFQEFIQWNSILKGQGMFDIDCYTTSKGEEDGDFLKQNNAIEKAEPIIKSEDPTSPRKSTALDLRVCSNPSRRHVRFLTESIPEQEDEDIDLCKPTGVVFRDLACFKNGYEFSAIITFVEDYDRLVFYINEMESSELFELSKMFHLQRYNSSKEIPQCAEVFGVSTNNESILRAVLLPCSDSSDSKAEQNLLLIDSGMELSLSNRYQLFCLPLKYRLLPAQALKCVLLCINNDMDADPKYLAEALRRNELKEVDFRVEHKQGRTLHLRLLENETSEKWGPPLMNVEEEKPGSANKNPFIDSSIGSKWTDHDNMAEEPTLTAGQAIASMNFVKADGSYQNSKEREMPWDKPNPPCSAGELVTITVTHVENVVSFYAQIEPKGNQQRVPLFWKDDSIRPDQKLMHPPKLQDLVLAQYHLDEFWYRARVMSFDRNTEEYTVFFVDYGNKEKVPLNRLFSYTATQNAVDGPFRAVRCRLAGICDMTAEDERRQKLAKQLLLVNILNQKFDVEIMNVSEDNELLVHIVDQEFCDVPDILQKLEYIRKI